MSGAGRVEGKLRDVRSVWLCAPHSTKWVEHTLDVRSIVHALQMRKVRLKESAHGRLNTVAQACNLHTWQAETRKSP